MRADGGEEFGGEGADVVEIQLEGVGWPHRRGGENMGNEFGGDGHGRIVLFVFVDRGVGFLVMNE